MVQKETGIGMTKGSHRERQSLISQRLERQAVRDVVKYAQNWEPFIIYLEPSMQVTMETNPPVIDKNSGKIYLPYPFVAPNTERTAKGAIFERQFYWDMFLITKALVQNPDYIELAKGQIENFKYLFERYGFIPNSSDINLLNRSQTPFLTSMIMDIYNITGDKEWLQRQTEFAQREYHDVWMITEEEALQRGVRFPKHRMDPNSLLISPSGRDIKHEAYPAVAETGQDSTAEYAGRAQDFLPVSMNTALYKYETDFAKAAQILGDRNAQRTWEEIARMRKKEMDEKMWDEKTGRYYNYDTIYKRKDTGYKGLTSYMPLWAGMASPEQARRMSQHISEFETPFGLTIATKDSRPSEHSLIRRTRLAVIDVALFGNKYSRYLPTTKDIFSRQQWDYPSIWAPMEYFALMGLKRYGYVNESDIIMMASLDAMANFYQKKKTLPEKLNGETGDNGYHFLYRDQEGFGWTNAKVDLYYEDLIKRYNLVD